MMVAAELVMRVPGGCFALLSKSHRSLSSRLQQYGKKHVSLHMECLKCPTYVSVLHPTLAYLQRQLKQRRLELRGAEMWSTGRYVGWHCLAI